MELLRRSAALTPADSKSYHLHRFAVPPGTEGLRLHFSYDRGGDFPHSLVTLSLFDPAGFRGAGHRFAPRQAFDLSAGDATPGLLPGPLPAGEWTVEVDIHCVVAPGRYSLAVEAVPEAPPRPRARPGPPPPGRGERRWLRGELHLHSTHSDGRWSVEEMAEAARGRDIDFMFLTDHNTVSGVEALREAAGDAIAVLPGQELTTFRGHALALGPERWLDWRTGREGRGMNDVAREVRAAGGILVVAHPDAPPDEVCTGCRWTHDDFDPALAHAVEVWGGLWDGPEERNPGCLELWRRWLNAGHRLTATGATDAHRHEDWVGPVPLTYVHAEGASLPDVLEALRQGRTYVSSGPRLEIRAAGGDGRSAAVGGTIDASGGPTVEVSCSSAPAAELRLVVGGEARARQRVEGEGRVAARVGPRDRWCCAELWRGPVLLAVTSPIYFR
jgi:predicted metal-dependent phosphoesterase TrpH